MKSITSSLLPLLAVVLILLISNKQKEQQKHINNQEISETYLDLAEAKEASKQLNKDILILFETSWCSTCKRFKRESFSNNKIEEEMNNYIVCLLDIEKDEKIAKKFNVKSFPCYLIIDSNDNIKKQGSGYKSTNMFFNWLKINQK
jgi:thiol:disulfide interchange protein